MFFDTRVSEIVLKAPFLNIKRERSTEICIRPPLSIRLENINDLSKGGLGYETHSDFLQMSQVKILRE